MIDRNPKRTYCHNCKQFIEDEEGKDHECLKGYYTLTFGDFQIEDGKIKCKCGGEGFKQTFHLNMSPKFVYNYQCAACNNVIGRESKVEGLIGSDDY